MKITIKLLHITFLFCSVNLVIYSQNKVNSSVKVQEIIAKKRAFNKKNGFGYSIQLYNGNENTARKYRARFRVEFPEIYSKLLYTAPEWKVQVGNYKTKLEADKDIIKFSEKFSGIIVVPMQK